MAIRSSDERKHIIKLFASLTKLGYDKLRTVIGEFLNSEIDQSDWDSWINTNKTQIGGKENLDWYISDEEGFLFAQFGDRWLLISLMPVLHQNEYSISTHSLLKSVGWLPNMWLYLASTKNKNDRTYDAPIAKELAQTPVDIGHYAFIFEALAGIFYEELEELSDFIREKIYSFIRNNKSKLNKIRSTFAQPPVLLGAGVDGLAYDIGGGKVLKIFTDQYSYNKAKEAFDRLHKNPDLAHSEALYYDVGTIGEFNATQVHYSIMEKMIPASKIEDQNGMYFISKITSAIADSILDNKDQFLLLKRQLNHPSKSKRIKDLIRLKAEQIEQKVRNTVSEPLEKVQETMPNLRKDWLSIFIEEIIMKYITGRSDLHGGNLGLTDTGLLRYFDSAHSSWQGDEYINV